MINALQTSGVAHSDEWICPQCQTVSPVGAKFCLVCGQALSHECPKCGHLNLITHRYCQQCGADMAVQAQKQALEEQARQEKADQWLQSQLARGLTKIVCPHCGGAKGQWSDYCSPCFGTGTLRSYGPRDSVLTELCSNCGGSGRLPEKTFRSCDLCDGYGYILYDQAYVTRKLRNQSGNKVISVLLTLLLVALGLSMGGLILYALLTFSFEYVFLSFIPGALTVPIIGLISKIEPKSESDLIFASMARPPRHY